MTPTDIISLDSLEYIPYIDEKGMILETSPSKIGVYAIFDQNKDLKFVGYSRDIYLSLKQHLVRQPQQCYWLKIHTITRPNRTQLEQICAYWIEENGKIPAGNDEDKKNWTDPIDAKVTMTETEKKDYEQSDELGKIKLLKKISRRVEEDLLLQLKSRNIQMEIRFNPKLKEQGLLDLK